MINNNTHASKSTVSEDVIHDILSNSRRRHMLRLLEDNGPTELGEIATEIAKKEFGENIDGSERKKVYVALLQCHCPRLEENDIIEMDQKTVSLTATADVVLSHLHYDPADDSDGFFSSLRETVTRSNPA